MDYKEEFENLKKKGGRIRKEVGINARTKSYL